jgi:hypothetical protein
VTQRTIAGRYVLEEPLGDSSWRATDTELGREVVVVLGDEAEAVAPHANIGQIFDRGEVDGEPFTVFEYAPDAEPVTLIQSPAPTARLLLPRSRTLALVAGVVLLAAAGIGAALLATAGQSNTDQPTGSLSVPVPTATSAPPTDESEPPPTTTEQETTTQKETSTQATTTAPTTAPPRATTVPPPPTTVEPPPTTTEEPPPTTTEATPPPPTTTGLGG